MENGFKEEKDALALIEELNGKQAKVKSIVKNITKKRAPLLFNLAELQAECSKKFKISLMRHYRWRRICMKKAHHLS